MVLVLNDKSHFSKTIRKTIHISCKEKVDGWMTTLYLIV